MRTDPAHGARTSIDRLGCRPLSWRCCRWDRYSPAKGSGKSA
jgi:hypothetical protein